ncbi:hypothetical protein BS78_05G288500 [Paspalum vaginatum]|nr:hypothetical protein BS78_05G288500 [Paspalum vaginatum]
MADTPEPFSPSIFLDLPPTPRGDGDDPASSSGDDHVLPFISRVLMEEEDTNDEAFLYTADHPALLQAQQPFAEILSDAVNNGSAELEDTNTRGAAADDVDLQVSALFGGGGHDGMLSRAFLNGMEEAKKFLPTTGTNSLLICSATDTSGAREHEQVKKDGKNRRTDDSVAGGGRNTKLMVSVPDEETDGETVDQMILHEFNVCISKLTMLHITTTGGGEVETTTTTTPTKKKKKRNTKKKNAANSKQHPSAGDDLHTLLIHCAQAVGNNDRLSAAKLLRQIKAQSSPKGDPNQRLAHCFAEGLEARLAGTGTQVYRSLVSKRTSAVEYLKAYHVYLNSCCFKKASFTFSNRSILKAIEAAAGRKTKTKTKMKVHIVDYGIDYGMQWPNLLRRFSTMEVPVEVRITGIDHPQPGFRPSSRLEETGRRLSRCARNLGVPFKFRSIVAAKWETIRAGDLGVDADELLIVNSLGPFTYLINEGVEDDVDSPSPRDTVLGNIRSLRPDVFILCVMSASYSSPFFVTRFREALSYYTALFDMLDATLPRDSEQRLLVERDLYGRCALNAIACEGRDRVERPEAYRQWQARNHRTGFTQLPLDPDTVEFVRDKVSSLYHKDFVIDTDQQWLLKGWKGRILYAISNWRVADHDSTST